MIQVIKPFDVKRYLFFIYIPSILNCGDVSPFIF